MPDSPHASTPLSQHGLQPLGAREGRPAVGRAAAVLLLAHGGPATPAEVPAFIREMLGSDVSDRRVAALTERYGAIGGSSPMAAIVQGIGEALARATQLPVCVGMRYGSPSIEDAVRRASDDGADLLASVYLSPHLPELTAERCRQSVDRCHHSRDHAPEVRHAGAWHRQPAYLEAEADATQAALRRLPDGRRDKARVVFSAHSLPTQAAHPADGYDGRVRESATLVAALAGLSPADWSVAYQSAPPSGAAWLGPHLPETIAMLAAAGVKDVVVTPLGFVVDSLEVLYDIDLELRAVAVRHSMNLQRAPLPNLSPALVDALNGAVRSVLPRTDAQKEPV
jgi:protoporphyrin/coproporphyrin ferrochelatase